MDERSEYLDEIYWLSMLEVNLCVGDSKGPINQGVYECP